MLRQGDIVKTNYGTGPYKIIEIDGPCVCPKYLDEINLDNPPASKPHFHLMVKKCDENGNVKKRETPSYLNGYRQDGSNVWRDDYLIFRSTTGEQLRLF